MPSFTIQPSHLAHMATRPPYIDFLITVEWPSVGADLPTCNFNRSHIESCTTLHMYIYSTCCYMVCNTPYLLWEMSTNTLNQVSMLFQYISTVEYIYSFLHIQYACYHGANAGYQPAHHMTVTKKLPIMVAYPNLSFEPFFWNETDAVVNVSCIFSACQVNIVYLISEKCF